ncbi:MAG: 3-dehydroquinate synthase [Ruminococcaceae bacterium]|nr:3-dehydroquinate synthase [Oscillospiraceae bacterium]
MKRVQVKTGSPYEVTIGRGLLPMAGELVREVIPPCRALIVTDSNVAPLYLDTVQKSLTDAGFSVSSHIFPAGEEQKNLDTLAGILTALAEAGLTRTDLVLALGGGVTGDMTGLASSLYLRGVRYVQIPTTLLAAVDSSVGGKTAIDFAGRKNIVGAFYQPIRVLCDLDTFDTLTPEIFRDGLAESIKYGAICDEALFRLFETAETLDMTEIVSACVAHKARIVEQDEHDTGLRQLLNFGHTAGHAMEACSNYRISHGHAVAMGMALMARAATRAGLCQDDSARRIAAVLEKYGLPTASPYPASALAAAALADKKRRGGSITVIVPTKTGTCVEQKLPVDELESFFALGMEEDL